MMSGFPDSLEPSLRRRTGIPFIILLILIAQAATLRAEEGVGEFDIDALRSMFTGVRSLEYSAHFELTRSFANDRIKPSVSIEFANRGSAFSFLITRKGLTQTGKVLRNGLAVGPDSRHLLVKDTLYVRNGNPVPDEIAKAEASLLAQYNAIFLPFAFIMEHAAMSSGERLMENSPPFLGGLHDQLVWNDISESLKKAQIAVKENAEGDREVVVKSREDASLGLGSGPVLFRVKLAKDLDYFPVSWEKFCLDERTGFKYRVLETDVVAGAGVNFRYAKKALLEKYFEGTEQPYLTFLIEVAEVSVNSIDDGHSFQLDPGLAELVHDLERDVRISVPK